MTLISANKSRKLTRDLTILDVDLAAVVPGANDVVRVKIGLRGETPLLDLDSAAASANGSTITKNTPSSGINRLEIVALDMGITPGVYTLELSLVDNADDGEIKHVDNQTFVVHDVMSGDVGLV